jgi:hypothetical protein
MNTDNELGGFSPMDILSKTLRTDESDSKTIVGGAVSDDDNWDVPEEVEERLDEAKDKYEDKIKGKPLAEVDEDETEEPIEGDEDDTETDDDNAPGASGFDPEIEGDVVEYFIEQFNNELDFKFADNEKPKTVKEVVKYIEELVNENSEPVYPTNEVKELAEFVSNGGNMREFYNRTYTAPVSLDELDIDDEDSQELVVRQNLSLRGFKEDDINRKVKRYKQLGTMYDEAEEALPDLKEYEQNTKEELLKAQLKHKQDTQKAQLDFIKSVENTINGVDDINGIKLSKQDKIELRDYMLKVGVDGKTAYQKEYQSTVTNFVKSAFYTKKGDAFSKQIERKAESQVAKKLRDRIEASRDKRSKNQGSTERGNKSPDMFKLFHSQYIKKND